MHALPVAEGPAPVADAAHPLQVTDRAGIAVASGPQADYAGASSGVEYALPTSLRTLHFDTLRLCASPLRDIDFHLFASLFTAPITMRHVGRPLTPTAVSAAFVAVLAEMDRVPARRLCWRLGTPADADVGLMSMSTWPSTGSAELGIMLVPTAQRTGVAREACAALLSEVFRTGLVSSVWLRHRRFNLAMETLAGRLGFRPADTTDGLCQWCLDAVEWQALARRSTRD
ncbi:GNAT family N-acetyltransferase [Luteimonas sp. XNQY3]|nr:GNAT family N-acetyltransferase [Luteimonas sp. XNQY3]MCD9007595.1 GNAT family N-acetyltransferase [Luteimonas sp. XNQY3]